MDPARATDPVGDDAGQDRDHSDEDDEVRGVLADGEAGHGGVVEMGDEGVLDQVDHEADGDQDATDLGQARDRRVRDWASLPIAWTL